MAEYLIKGETLKATADAIRAKLPMEQLVIREDLIADANTFIDGAVTIAYYEYIDYGNQYGEQGAHSTDGFIAFGYLPNNEGNTVPVIFKTDLDAAKYDQEFIDPDYEDTFYYVGNVTVDGTTYNKWRKIETILDGGFTWTSEYQQYVYTNEIVGTATKPNTEEINPVNFPEKINAVYEAGKAIGINSDIFKSLIDRSITTIDLTKFGNITTIGAYAFCQCTNLTDVILPYVEVIGENAFYNCTNLNTVFYTGSLQEWEERVTVGSGNEQLTNAISFYSEEDMSDDGASYWHYVDGVPTLWSQVSRGLEYTLLDDGTYSVTGRGTCTDTDLVIPETYRNIPITQIGENAFSGYSSLKTIDIPDSVTTIGQYAFRQSGLTTIRLPSNITVISAYTFMRCSSLTSVYIPRGVTSIGISAFFECQNLTDVYYSGSSDEWYDIDIATNTQLTSATKHYGIMADETFAYQINHDWTEYAAIGIDNVEHDGNLSIADTINGLPVTSIASRAFYGNQSIYSVVIGSNVTEINPGAFLGCRELTSLTIPVSVSYMGYDAFADTGLEGEYATIKYEGNAIQWMDISLGESAISDNITFLAPLPSYTDGQGVTYESSSDNSYYVCASVKDTGESDIVIYDYINEIPVKEIDSLAFSHCSATGITIPENILIISNVAFNACYNLIDISVDENNQNYKSIDGVLYSKNGETLITYPTGKAQTSFVVPDDVKIIGPHAFYDCDRLKSITIPDGLTTIERYAIDSCDGLTSITLPSSVTSIDTEVFYECPPIDIYVPWSEGEVANAPWGTSGEVYYNS